MKTVGIATGMMNTGITSIMVTGTETEATGSTITTNMNSFESAQSRSKKAVDNLITSCPLSTKAERDLGLWPKGAGENASRRDGAIVAWHEVPGTAPPKRAVPEGTV
jgi:hypothetical protein